MGIGCQKLYVTRIDNDEKDLLLSEWKPEIRAGEENRNKVFQPKGTCIGYDMFIPNIFPDLKWEDGPQEVDVVDCEEETGLYMVIIDDYFGGEAHLYNVKPKLVIDGEKGKNGRVHRRYIMPHQSEYHREDYPYEYWSMHINHCLYPHNRESYDKVGNVKLVIKNNN